MLAFNTQCRIVFLMAFLESGVFCSAKDYTQGLNWMVERNELLADEHYLMMVRLWSFEKEAAMMPVKMVEVRPGQQLTFIKFVMLSAAGQPQIRVDEYMRSNRLIRPNSIHIADPHHGEAYQVDELYFRSDPEAAPLDVFAFDDDLSESRKCPIK